MADNTSSGGGKILLPLIVLAAAVAAGWLWMQQPVSQTPDATTQAAAEAPALNEVAPAAEQAAGVTEATEADDGDEDDAAYGASSTMAVEAPVEAPAADATVTTPLIMPETATTAPVDTTTAAPAVEGAVEGAVSDAAAGAATAVEGAVEGAAPAVDEAVPPVTTTPETPVTPTEVAPQPAPAQ